MKETRFLILYGVIFSILFFTGCNLLDFRQKKEALEFEKMNVQYIRYGGWINRSELIILSSGEASAKVIAHASRNVLKDTSAILTVMQREQLANSFSSFTRYERHYHPEKFMTDGNFHQIVLIYDGLADTVSAYMPYQAALPKNLMKLIVDLDELHQSIIEPGD